MSTTDTTKLQTPERVAFLNIQNGHIFFDCNPTEARLAVKHVEHIRQQGEFKVLYETKSQIVNKVTTSARKSRARWIPLLKDETYKRRVPLTLSTINEMFVELEKWDYMVSEIIMGPTMYGDIRDFGKSVVDFETQKVVLAIGIFATIFTADILVRKWVKENGIILVSRFKNGKEIDKPKIMKFLLFPSGFEMASRN